MHSNLICFGSSVWFAIPHKTNKDDKKLERGLSLLAPSFLLPAYSVINKTLLWRRLINVSLFLYKSLFSFNGHTLINLIKMVIDQMPSYNILILSCVSVELVECISADHNL